MVRFTSEFWTLIRDLLRPWTIRSGGWALIHSLSVLQTALPCKEAGFAKRPKRFPDTFCFLNIARTMIWMISVKSILLSLEVAALSPSCGPVFKLNAHFRECFWCIFFQALVHGNAPSWGTFPPSAAQNWRQYDLAQARTRSQ